MSSLKHVHIVMHTYASEAKRPRHDVGGQHKKHLQFLAFLLARI